MFSYCNNNPCLYADYRGTDGEVLSKWYEVMQGLPEADGPLPYGDALFLLGAGICFIIDLFGSKSLVAKDSVPDGKAKPVDIAEETSPDGSPTNETWVPDVTYPGDDPTKAPSGTTWRGNGEPGSGKGNYHNPNTGESWHPDLNHPAPIGPHWDYKDPYGNWWRIGPDNIPMPK